MIGHRTGTVVDAFTTRDEARAAINELQDRGFSPQQIGLASRDAVHEGTDSDNSYVAEGAAAGVATGAGLGALWGLGVISGVMPVLGPAIAGGTLAAILSSAAAGATAAGFAGVLIGMGIPKEEAAHYESELHAGRTIVTVAAGDRADEASEIMARHGGHAQTTPASLAGIR